MNTKEQETADLATLQNTQAPWAEQSQALMRLSIQQKPEALVFIKSKLAAKDQKLAPWATRALGYFTVTEAFELIRTQLHDTNPIVREAAVDALGMRAHPEKMKLLDEAQKLVQTPNEKARLMMARIRMSPSPEEKSKQAKEVIGELQTKSLDPSARNYLVSQIFFQSPRTHEVEAYFNSLSTQLSSVDELSAIAAVRALKVYCPSNRYDKIREALNRKGISVSAQSQILNELIFHAGPEAQSIFDKTTASTQLAKPFLENLKGQLTNPKIKSPCDARPQSTATTTQTATKRT
jgi:hypothetical protein